MYCVERTSVTTTSHAYRGAFNHSVVCNSIYKASITLSTA